MCKYNRIAFADFLESTVSDSQRIIVSNGLHQLRVTSSNSLLANNLLNSTIIKNKGYKLYIPTSLVSRKFVAHDVDTHLSPHTISCRISQDILDLIISIRRRAINSGKVSDMVDFVFYGIKIHPSITISGVVF